MASTHTLLNGKKYREGQLALIESEYVSSGCLAVNKNDNQLYVVNHIISSGLFRTESEFTHPRHPKDYNFFNLILSAWEEPGRGDWAYSENGTPKLQFQTSYNKNIQQNGWQRVVASTDPLLFSSCGNCGVIKTLPSESCDTCGCTVKPSVLKLPKFISKAFIDKNTRGILFELNEDFTPTNTDGYVTTRSIKTQWCRKEMETALVTFALEIDKKYRNYGSSDHSVAYDMLPEFIEQNLF